MFSLQPPASRLASLHLLSLLEETMHAHVASHAVPGDDSSVVCRTEDLASCLGCCVCLQVNERSQMLLQQFAALQGNYCAVTGTCIDSIPSLSLVS